jgi:hypothetical protein
VRKRASYEEVRRYWDLGEVLDAIEVLEMMDDLEQDQLEADRREAKRKAKR